MALKSDPKPSPPRAVQACHELLVWLIPLLDHFPRARRFTLGERLESGLLAVLEGQLFTALMPSEPPVYSGLR
ncbi:MAG: hypothetical protein KDK05_27795 [Candidatus Competibacteraceae bacterium]|nr:hypothetical protein [Candidatus Competibacteraceae bacterium]